LARKILLADDSVTAQNMGRKILADAGYEVITVNNGSAALKKIAELKPDLIVLDVYMPGYSGLEVCQRLKEAQETSRVPVLLTVGKLEPFKPEEAKRARADGFIVKPFEASELLSALSKLEDKIVPRPEASKPGRFARVSASIEEGRYDKTVAIEEDTGWKDRIGFPSKKKGKPAKEEEDESEIYNSMNKDLRTVVERKSTEKPHESKAEETRVDLGALAPEGLPKDVTPEEIAALAAAAAQVQSKIVQSKTAEAKIEAKTEDSRHAEPTPAAAQIEQKEQKEQAAELSQPVAEVPPPATATPVPGATFADRKPEEKIEEKAAEKIEVPAEKLSDAPKEAASTAAPSTAEVIAAIAGLELDSVTSTSPGAAAENGSWASSSSSAVGQPADEPVTMAMAAGAASGGGPSRWTAVSVALAPEEAAISLEQEMQKAYAAFAAADAAHAGFDTAPPEIQPAAPEPAITDSAAAAATSSPSPAAASEPVVPVASATTEAITAAAKELEAVAASYVEQETQKTPTPEPFESAPVEKTEAAVQTALEAPQTVEAKFEASAEQIPEQGPVMAASEPETSKLETAHQEAPEPAHEEPANQQSNDSAPAPEFAIAAAAPEQMPEAPESSPEMTSAAVVDEVPAQQIPAPASDVSEISASASTSVPVTRGPKDESDIAATTAAAWASWRRIRESGTPKSDKEVEDSAVGSQDEAARAVAAGAEKTPEAPGDTEGISDIVDSVLADLRPKIYEEITRKMGKKK
jgi:two-component system chemotaxis response regulator CheY